uniref:Uncharacterized protein n=1 Tax=Babesia bovis TaxID=5865 RepID=A7AQK5_BABBO|eukprot:XP_001610392.1 hypothetical protein [Babesia bovis T2Bo]
MLLCDVFRDIRNATLDGEICAYQSIYRPLTMSKWSANQQHLMMGGSVVMTVEWQVKPGLTTLSSDRTPNILYKGAFDNICRRNTQDTMITYLWEPIEIASSRDCQASV